MMLTLHRLMHFSKLLMKSASIQTGSLRHMTNIGHRRFSAKNAEMRITSYLLRYLLQAETLVQQAIKQSRAEQRERHFLSHLLLIVFHTQKNPNKWQLKELYSEQFGMYFVKKTKKWKEKQQERAPNLILHTCVLWLCFLSFFFFFRENA